MLTDAMVATIKDAAAGLLELQGRCASSDVSEHPRRDARGRPKTEERLSGLEADIRSLVDPQSQVDPKFQSAFAYTRMTAASVRQALIDRKGYSPDDLPCERTLCRILTPFGVLEVAGALLSITFGTSRETSDFVVDCLQPWWDQRKEFYPQIRKLAINLDRGPQIASHGTQFLKRMVEFADQTNLEIELIYDPPYHSKYNPIQRCWGVLEMHCSGTLLDTVQKTLGWAKTMTSKGTQPVVGLLDRVYQTGVRRTKAALKPYQERLGRSEALPKWSVSIEPQPPTVAVPR